MAWENVERMQHGLAAFNRGDVDALAELMSPEGKIVPLRAALEDAAYSGQHAAHEFWSDAMGSWSELRADIEEFRDFGDQVLAVGWLKGKARDTGAAVETRVAWIATFDGRYINEFRTYASEAEALEAVGLSE